jgi:uroporphyrinogen decarboxylase
MLDLSKFGQAKVLPLTREQMIDLIEGRYLGRPAVVNEGHWLHIDELDPSKHEVLNQLVQDYPCDVQPFYVLKPKNFGSPGERYVWCDVPDADPALTRDPNISVGVDEETAISWEFINQISQDVPDPDSVDILINAPTPDGRYRLFQASTFFFNRMWLYRGLTNSLTDMYTDPEFLHAILRKLAKYYKRIVSIAVERADIDGVTFCDDLGMQQGSFMSPEMFEEFYLPYYQEVFDHVHALGKHIWFHCCGDVSDFAAILIKAGIDVLHPIQKFANEEKRFIQQYGNQVTTWVGMDLQRVLPFGSQAEVKQETRFIIDTFMAVNNRLILTISNRLEDNVPIENFISFVEEAYRYGQYVVEHGVGDNKSPCYENRKKWYGKENG